MRDKLSMICSNLKCQEWIKAEKASQKDLKCMKCKQVSCFNCKQPIHKGKACEKDMTVDEFIDGLGKKDYKKCPKCNYKIFKDGGCNHMTCKCGYEWCWLCSQKYTPAHYSRENPLGC